MCTNFAKKVKGDKSLVAYKVLGVNSIHGCIMTPFTHRVLDKDELSGRRDFIALGYDRTELTTDGAILREGYIHTYASKEAVVYDFFNYYQYHMGEYHSFTEYKVYEVEIPIDERNRDNVWKGIFDTDQSLHSYASHSVRFKREIPVTELIKWRKEITKNKTFEKKIDMPLTYKYYGSIRN